MLNRPRPGDAPPGFVPLDRRYLHVNVDLNDRCNLDCIHCPFVWMRNEQPTTGKMSEEMLVRIGREIFPFTLRASLSSFHEPLMAVDRLFMAMELAREAGVAQIDFHTNALLLTEEIAEGLFARGLTMLLFSVDGATEETYQRIRKGGSLARFVERVEIAGQVRRDMGLEEQLPFRFTACMIRENLHEAVALVELAAGLGIDWIELRIAMLADVAEAGDDQKICHDPMAADQAFRAARARGAELGLRVTTPPTMDELQATNLPRPRFTNCLYPWSTIQITPTGGLLPCCLWHGADVLDRLDDRPFEQIWNGEAFRDLRVELETASLSRRGCRDCGVHFHVADPEFWQTFEFVRES